MTPLLRLPIAIGAALLAGVLLWLSFAPVGWGLAAVLGTGLLAAAAWGAGVRRGLALGAVTGAVFFCLLLEWMRVIGVDAWLALAALCAAWLALMGAGIAVVTRLPGAPVWIGALWVLQEALRGRIPLGGFPWGSLAFGQADSPLGGWTPWLAAPGVTFVVGASGAALVAAGVALRAGRRRAATAWGAAIAAAVILPLVLPTLGAAADAPTATVAIVQGGTPQVGMGAMDVRRAVLDNHVRETMALAEAVAAGEIEQPDFVLWPENSSDIDPFADPSVADAITAAARAVGAPILVGAVTAVPDNPLGVWNVGIVWDPAAGPTDMYIKTHPVPFGEYVPFRDVLARVIGRFDRVPRDFIPGNTPGNLTIGGVDVGNVICFEIGYRDVVDAVIDGGAQVLTVQTNNATYGGTSQPAQQLGIERIRASEFGRTVLVAATSGISAVIAPDRTITQSMSEGDTGWVVTDVPLSDAATPASTLGHVLEVAVCLVGAAAVVVAVIRTRRRSAPSIT